MRSTCFKHLPSAHVEALLIRLCLNWADHRTLHPCVYFEVQIFQFSLAETGGGIQNKEDCIGEGVENSVSSEPTIAVHPDSSAKGEIREYNMCTLSLTEYPGLSAGA